MLSRTLVIRQEWEFRPLGLAWCRCCLREWVGMDIALSRGACRMMEFFRLTDLVSTMWPHQPWIQKSLINVSHKKQLLSRPMLFYLRAYGWQIFAVHQSMNMCDGVSLYGTGVVGGRGWWEVSLNPNFTKDVSSLCVSLLSMSVNKIRSLHLPFLEGI